MPNPGTKNKGGRPKKYANPEERKAAHAQQKRDSSHRRQEASYRQELQIQLDPRAILEPHLAALGPIIPALGIQAEGLDLPADLDLTDSGTVPWTEQDLQNDAFPTAVEDGEFSPEPFAVAGIERDTDPSDTLQGIEVNTNPAVSVEPDDPPSPRALTIRTRDPTVSSISFPSAPVSRTVSAPVPTPTRASPAASTLLRLRSPIRTRSRAAITVTPTSDSDVVPAERTIPAEEGDERGRREDRPEGEHEREPERTRSQTEGNAEGENIDIAQKLAEQLVAFHGCDHEAHREMDREHHSVVTAHHSIEQLSLVLQELPDTLASPKMLPQGQHTHLEAKRWKSAFLGTRPEQPDDCEEKIHVCLHASDTQTAAATAAITSDIDSIMGFPSSLAVARQGIRFNLTPHVISNLKTDIHLKMTVAENHRRRSVPLHEVPHYLLGGVIGLDLSIYLFFPQLYRAEAQNSYLKQATLERWTDGVLLPAIYSQISASTAQHYPSNYEHSKLSSLARNTESHASLGKAGSRHQFIHHFLQPEVLEEVWETILATVEEPGFEDFRGVQLFLTGKNFKVWTQSQTWRGVWDPFFRRWDDAIDSAYLDESQAWIDLGKEVCAPPSFLANQNMGDQVPQVYLWRPCCLGSYWRHASYGAPARKSYRAFYQMALLKDASDMTVLTPPQSISRQQGLVYSQFYHSSKEIFDANKAFPFQDRFLESLALDPTLRSSWQHAAGAHNHRPETLMKSYLHSKARCHAGLRGSMQKSFGIREEHRMTLTLARQVQERLRAMGWWNAPISGPGPTDPRPYRSLPSETFLNFLYYNINKFTTGFEYVYSLRVKNLVQWEHSKVMIMFLRSLKFGYTARPLPREMALWRDQVVRPNGKRHEGLGLSHTVDKFGYGWHRDKIDWDQFHFKAQLTDYMLFGNVHMAEAYRKRWREVKEITDDFLKIEQIARWLEMYQPCRRIRQYLLNFLLQICLVHFRKDVFGSVKSSIKEEHREAAIRGEFMLCRRDLVQILLPGAAEEEKDVWLVKGNKMAFKDLEQFVDFLWDHNDGYERKHWDDKGYRTLYQRCVRLIRRTAGRETAQRWKKHLKRLFVLNNWILPYPNEAVFWQHTKWGERMWLSVYHAELADGLDEEVWDYDRRLYRLYRSDGWIIGRRERQVIRGRPADCPDFVDVSMVELDEEVVEHWEEYLQDARVRARRPEVDGVEIIL